MEVLANTMVVTILQYIIVSNQCAVHLHLYSVTHQLCFNKAEKVNKRQMDSFNIYKKKEKEITQSLKC